MRYSFVSNAEIFCGIIGLRPDCGDIDERIMSTISPEFNEKIPEAPFASTALELHELNLAPVPCWEEDGKKPSITGFTECRFGPDTLEDFATRFGSQNIGIVTGKLSGVVIVDIDNPDLLEAMLERFGEPLLITETPSGGYHLWYRWDGEGCRNLRETEGLAVDIKGNGGFVVVPPSIRPSSGRPYKFIRGSWEDVQNLTKMRPGALQHIEDGIQPLSAIQRGKRNDTIFKLLLREVKHCDDLGVLFDVAQTINQDHTVDSLPDNELRRIAESAWNYEVADSNWVGKEARVQLTVSEIDRLIPHSDALALWVVIMRCHWDKNRGPFALSPKAMDRDQVIPGWGAKRYRSAIKVLIKLEMLDRVHEGGNKPHDPHLYVWKRPIQAKGAAEEPNITKHPPIGGIPIKPVSLTLN